MPAWACPRLSLFSVRVVRWVNFAIPSGRVTPNRALAFAVALSLAGFADLWLGVNLLAALLRQLFAVVTTGQKWDAAIAAGGRREVIQPAA